VRVELPPGTSPRCLSGPDSLVSWDRSTTRQRELDAWCAGVGPPVVVSNPAPAGTRIRRLVVLSWNVHVGGGRLHELTALTRLRSGQLGADTGLVLLIQETFRGGAPVGAAPRGAPAPGAIRPGRRSGDVVGLARRLGLSAFYVPSMRNGGSDDPRRWEDRGSAILSTEPLSDLAAIELPLARQRRVAVMATVTPRNPAAQPMRFVSAHFDVVPFGGGAVRQAQHLAQRLTALQDRRLPLIIGADTNATSGFRHGTVTELAKVARVLRQCGTGRTSAWFARSDFLFSDLDESAITDCETLDQRYGSDHLPIVMTIGFGTG
jgi:endonuclease/exonuclease/phosphatase family metal-dependent hydrolase